VAHSGRVANRTHVVHVVYEAHRTHNTHTASAAHVGHGSLIRPTPASPNGSRPRFVP